MGESVGTYEPLPWFWSDQYGQKLQLAGTTHGYDAFAVVHGELDRPKFAAIYGRAGRICGVVGMSRPRDVLRYRKMIEAGDSWEAALAVA